MSADDLIADLTRLGVRLEAHGDRLRYSPRSAVAPVLLDRMKTHKSELLVATKAPSKVENVHFTSKKDDCETPQALFDELNSEFGFILDVCADNLNTKCTQYFSRSTDGLPQTWHGTCWMNPPYGREIGKWMAKAHESSLEGVTVVCLVPARTDTKWWHEYAMRGEIRYLKGRLKFGNAKNSAPFPSAIIVFRPINKTRNNG